MNPTSDSTPSPDRIWDAVQSPLGATIIGGLAVVLIAWLASMLVARARRVKYRDLLRGVRDRVLSWRPVTVGRLNREVAAAHAAGFKERDDEVAMQRASPSRPSWRLQANGRELGDVDGPYQGFWLWNNGHPVSDVEISGDPEFVRFRQRAVFGSADGNSGQFLAMDLTERAHVEGFTLTFTWRNRFGDADTEDISFEPQWIAQEGVETPAMTYQRGKADGMSEGHAAGVEIGRQAMRAEIDNQRMRPVKKARWLVLRDPEDTRDGWVLVNMAEGAVATEVELDADYDFKFLSATGWESLSGVDHGKFQGYTGNPVTVFNVEWNDASGSRQTARVEYQGPDTGEYF